MTSILCNGAYNINNSNLSFSSHLINREGKLKTLMTKTLLKYYYITT